MAVEESFSGHFFGVFGDELIDNEVIAIGAFWVDGSFWLGSDVGSSNDTGGVE